MLQYATFAAGCFWGVEKRFRQVPGVVDAVVGYAGGHVERPSYKIVCTGTTGHAEAVQVTFDAEQVTYLQLLNAFWQMHNPTTPNRQGVDVGSQYRSVIFYHDEEQHQQAIASKQSQEELGRYNAPIVTEIVPVTRFYRAEEYHQRYLEKHGQSY